MPITVNIKYNGTDGNALKFAEEMTASGTVAAGATLAMATVATTSTTVAATIATASTTIAITGRLLLHVSFGLGQEGLAAELDLAVLLVVLWLPSLMRRGNDLNLVACPRTPLY